MTTEYLEEDDDFIGSFRVFAQHGLLIFRDVRSADTHEGWDGQAAVHAGTDSLYLRVQPSVDGPVEVEVYQDGSDDLALEDAVLYEGTISSAHGEFVVHDPNEWISMRVVTDEPGPARLRISGDDELMPSHVRIQIWY